VRTLGLANLAIEDRPGMQLSHFESISGLENNLMWRGSSKDSTLAEKRYIEGRSM